MAKTKDTITKWRDDLRLIHQFAVQGADCADGLHEELATIADICEAMLRDLEDQPA